MSVLLRGAPVIYFPNCLIGILAPDKSDYDGRRIGICDSTEHDRKTIIRPSGKNYRTSGNMVLRVTVRRLKGLPDLK